MSTDRQSLLEQATAVRLNAYAPYSHFLVGACIETENGKLFTACNVENASYGLTICAESNAVGAMLSAGENKIKQIAIVVKGPGVSAPCGACRQRINEFATPETLIHLYDLQGNASTHTLGSLLPHSFGPNDLLPT